MFDSTELKGVEMLNINTDNMSLIGQNSLSGSQNALSQAINRLSSGKRINTAADDAAGLAIARSQPASINALTLGAANLSKAQVLQQAGIPVLAQANSMQQQVLKLLQ
jgi:flagellin